MSRCWAALVGLFVVAAQLVGCGSSRAPGLSSSGSILVGALFPLSGSVASLAQDEYAGVEIGRDLVNDDGGVGGRRIELDTRQLSSREEAAPRIAELAADGVTTVIGTYSSQLSLPASDAAARAGLVYWEAGAVADRVTGRGLPRVFRVGATGSNLGSNSARFLAEQVAPRLGRTPQQVRVSVVYEDDDYGTSVTDAAVATAQARGMQLVSRTPYDAYSPDWNHVLGAVTAARPDVLVLASYIPDGVAFRRAMLARGLHVGALIGSTMAECGPEFGAMLDADAIGIFASDRPGNGFNPAALDASARALDARFATAWRARMHRDPTEEGIAGFSAAWALFHDVLPQTGGRYDADSVAAAARLQDLPEGSLPNGGGLRFASTAGLLGQNLRAASVIWQWQAVRHSVVVWPAAYATGTIGLVPLPR